MEYLNNSFLTEYLNSRVFYNKGFNYEQHENFNKKPKIYGGNNNDSNEMDIKRFVELIKNIHDNISHNLTNSIVEHLHDKFNNQCGYNINSMEVNIDEIKQLILDSIINKFNLGNYVPKNRTYNIIHKDIKNDELWNDISLDLLEEDENAKYNIYNLSDDATINTMAIEEVYDKYMVYGSPYYNVYLEYYNNLMNELSYKLDSKTINNIRYIHDKNAL
jgi:hypothetical protein